MGAVASLAITTPVVFGIATWYCKAKNKVDGWGVVAVIFIFGASMAGGPIGIAALQAGDTGTGVVGDGVTSVQQNFDPATGKAIGR